MVTTEFRLLAQGVVWFSDDSMKRINELMLHQCSALRSAYQAIHKHGLEGNDVVKYVKKNYMSLLNQRYVFGACCWASAINQDNSIFGGKDLWYKLVNGKIPKEEWAETRNRQLYSHGDRSKKGNANIRAKGNKLFVKDPIGRKIWVEGKLYLPEKFNPDWDCYDVRLIRIDNNRCRIVISWVETTPNPLPTVPGILGIDTNPDGFAISELDGNGNLINHYYETTYRVPFAQKDKRENDIYLAAIEVVEIAKRVHKPIAIEQLDFNPSNKSEGSKKFRRMKSNFAHRKMLEAIKRRALKEGILVIEVEPAFTSILGALKYQKMYSLSVHNAAAIVIGRRALGLLEREDFNVSEIEVDVKPERKRKKKKPKSKKKKATKKISKKKTYKPTKTKQTMLNLEGRGVGKRLSKKAWSWLKDCFLKPKPVILTGSCLATGLETRHLGHSTGGTVGESQLTTGRLGQGEILVGGRKNLSDSF